MTNGFPKGAERAFESHEAFERAGEWFELETTRFDARATAEETDENTVTVTLEVRAPTLSAATTDEVGPAVEAGWLETYDRRLEDAPGAVRGTVSLVDRRVFEESDDVVAVYVFEPGTTEAAPNVAKTMAEYTEGTYVEGIVPGYEYQPPVSELLSRAEQGGYDGDDGDDRTGNLGPTPL